MKLHEAEEFAIASPEVAIEQNEELMITLSSTTALKKALNSKV